MINQLLITPAIAFLCGFFVVGPIVYKANPGKYARILWYIVPGLIAVTIWKAFIA